MAKINFYLEKRNDKEGKPITKNVPLRFSISYGSRYMSSTGLRVDEKDWDQEKQRVKGSHPQAIHLNKILTDLKTELSDLYYKGMAERLLLNSDYFAKSLTKNQKSDRGFFERLDEYIDEGRNKWQSGTVKKFITIKNHLQELSEKKRIKVEFRELNDRFLTKLLDFYFSDKKYINTHVRKNLRFLQQFLNWATKKGYNRNMEYKEWKLETGSKTEKASENISLSVQEIFQVINTNVQGTPLERVKDYLILACFTGLRYSDIANLKKSNIDFERRMITCTTIKTGDRTTIPFNEFSAEILEKYRESKNLNSKGLDMAFPAVSNQKTNKGLKKLAKKAGLNEMVPITYYRRNERIDEAYPKHELITSHIGRKTFITLSIMLDIKSEIVMGITTHKSHKTMENYYSIDTPMKEQAMKQFSREKLLAYVQN